MEVLAGCSALVTGGAGFIGSHLCSALLDLGCRVTVLDDLSSGSLRNVRPGVDFVEGSVTDEGLVRTISERVDHVFHLAAMVSVPQTVRDPAGSYERNVWGTESVLRACVKHRVQSLVFASSAAVYGDAPSLPSKESDSIRCVSPYAAGKACGEMLVQSAACSLGLPAASLRFFNVFGVGQDPRSPYAAAISAFVDASIAGRAPTIFGTGDQTRDFVPVADVVQALLLAAARASIVGGRAFNIGTGVQRRLLDVLGMIAKASESYAAPVFRPARPGDVRDSVADITQARDLLGYAPSNDFAGAIAQLVAFERSRRASAPD